MSGNEDMIFTELQQQPVLGIETEPVNAGLGPLRRIVIGCGSLAVNENKSPLTGRQLQAAELASVGMPIAEIASHMLIAYDTAQDNFRSVYNHFGMHSRHGIASVLLESGVYNDVVPCEPLDLNRSDHTVVSGIAAGLSMNTISRTHGLANSTLRRHIRYVTYRTGWRGPERVALAALVSGEVTLEDVAAARYKAARDQEASDGRMSSYPAETV